MTNINVYRAAGKDVTGLATAKEAFEIADLNFQVFKSQLRDGLGRPVNAWGTFRWNDADWQAKRGDAAIFLGTVGADYEIIPHIKGFAMADALMQTSTGAHYATVGTWDEGQIVWAQCDLGLSYRVGDDVHKNFLLFCTSHDGSKRFQVKLVDTRIVCQNTFRAALREDTENAFSVRHTKNADVKLEEARKALSLVTDDIKTVEQKLQWLATRKMTREATVSILDRLFPPTEKTDDSGNKVLTTSTRRNNVLDEVLKLYEDNDGDAFPEQRGSAYNFVNAVTNYADHNRGRGTEAQKAQSAIFGTGDKLKTSALELILAEAENLPQLARVDFSKSSTPVLDSILAA